jgi:hypothetical protein
MKKIYLALVAVLVSVFNMSAVDLYLRGNLTGSSWPALPKYQFTESSSGVYTLNVDELYGEFKIADASWSNDYNFGSNGTAIVLGEAYSCVSMGANMTLAVGQASNVTLTFNLSTKTLTVSGQQQENTYDKLYVIGSINGGDWDESIQTYPLNPTNSSNTSFTGNIEITAASYFKLKAGQVIYGPGQGATEDVTVAVPFEGDIFNPAGDKAYFINPGTYTITVNLATNASSGSIVVTGSTSLDETLFILGDYSLDGTEIHWSPSQSIPMTNVASGKFEAKNVTFIYGADAAASAYFSFATKQSADWETLGNRYGATENDFAVLEGTYSLILGTNSFAIAPGTYDINVDLNAMTIEVVAGNDAVNGIELDEDQIVNVYNFSGVKVMSGVKASEATNNLPKGLYIIGGQKVIVK